MFFPGSTVALNVPVLVRGVVRVSRTKKSDMSNDTDDTLDDVSDFFVRCSDGHILADMCRQKNLI